MSKKPRIKVLFVCMGNICRSPTAEGVFRHLVKQEGLEHAIETDSAGTHAYHVGEPPDHRAQNTASNRGIDLSDLRARRVLSKDFEEFDYILAMDKDNHYLLSGICPDNQDDLESQLYMFLDFAKSSKVKEVPDPYYGGDKGFENVFDLVEEASRGLLEDIRKRYLQK